MFKDVKCSKTTIKPKQKLLRQIILEGFAKQEERWERQEKFNKRQEQFNQIVLDQFKKHEWIK